MKSQSKSMRMSNACICQIPKLSLLFVFALFTTVFSAQNTSLQWANSINSNSFLGYTRSAIDASGNYYNLGNFNATIDFDPGAGVNNVTGNGGFITKLNAAGLFQWVVTIPGTTVYNAETDAAGNIIVVGSYAGTVDFDPGAGTNNMTAVGNNDIFILKLSSTGTFVWAKSIGGSGNDVANCVTTGANGVIAVSGQFVGTVDFDPSTNTNNLVPQVSDGVFVLKLDAAGNYVWAKQLSGNGVGTAVGIKFDSSSNVILLGHFFGTIDFDPGTGTANRTGNPYPGRPHVYVAKLDASGSYGWANQYSSTFDINAVDLEISNTGSILFAGTFIGAVDFDPSTSVFQLSNNVNYSGYVSELSTLGTLNWVKNLTGTGGSNIFGLAKDANGNVYCGGTQFGSIDFDPSPAVSNITTSTWSSFIVSFSSTGNFNWVNSFTGTGNSQPNGLSALPSGDLYMNGFFIGLVDFNPNAGTNNLSSGIGQDNYNLKISQGPFTQLDANSCGITLTTLNQNLYCITVAGATNYRYEITGPNNFYATYNRTNSLTNLDLSWISSIAYNKTYSIRVEAFVGGQWRGYGPACSVTTPTPPTTQLALNSCGITLSSLTQDLYCNPVVGASNYNYVIYDGANMVADYYRTNGLTNLQLWWHPAIGYGKTYSIKVRAMVGGEWHSFGNLCSVTTPTPPTTQLSNASCGITLGTLDQTINCDPIVGATNYNYKIYDGSNLVADYFRTNGLTNLQLSWINTIRYGKTYSVIVRAFVGSAWHNFGNACSVTTPTPPTTQLAPASCGIVMTSYDQVLNCNPVVGATNYNYKIYDGTNLVADYYRTNGLTNFQLTWLSTIEYNKTYNVQVSASVGGFWHPVGPVCTITTPTPPTTQLNATSCGINLSTMSQVLNCNAVIGASNYRYDIYLNNSPVTTFVRGSYATDFTMPWAIANPQLSTTYDIRVAANVGGAWLPYGNFCSVATAASPKMPGEDGHQSDDLTGIATNYASEFTVKALPNPTQKSTTINVDKSYQQASVKLNTALGQTLLSKHFNDSQEIIIDIDYPAGIYYLEVQIDNQYSKTIKVVKE